MHQTEKSRTQNHQSQNQKFSSQLI